MDAAQAPETTAQLERVLFEVKKVIVGQDRAIERMIVSLLARGHCLLESVPGRQQADEHAFDHVILPDNDLGNLLPDRVQPLDGELELRFSSHASHCRAAGVEQTGVEDGER